jgi:hypothetical protein
MSAVQTEGVELRRAAARGLWHGLALAALIVSLLYQVAGEDAGSGATRAWAGFAVEAPGPIASADLVRGH